MNGNSLFPSIKRLCSLCQHHHQNTNLGVNAMELCRRIELSFPNIGGEAEHLTINHTDIGDYDVDDDEDGPVVVPFNEIEASIDRSSKLPKLSVVRDDTKSIYSSKYPFLFASMIEDEDILMTCARILDEKSDVTAVREAASYLEEVENLSANDQSI